MSQHIIRPERSDERSPRNAVEGQVMRELSRPSTTPHTPALAGGAKEKQERVAPLTLSRHLRRTPVRYALSGGRMICCDIFHSIHAKTFLEKKSITAIMSVQGDSHLRDA